MILAPCHDIVYTSEMNKQVRCFPVSMIMDDNTKRFGLTMTLPLPSGNDCAFLNRREFFRLLDNVRKIPDNLYSRSDLENICVLDIILSC